MKYYGLFRNTEPCRPIEIINENDKRLSENYLVKNGFIARQVFRKQKDLYSQFGLKIPSDLTEK